MIETDALRTGGNSSGTRARKFARLKRRADFQRAARGRRIHSKAFSFQALLRPPAATEIEPRFGLTVTRKVGNSVVRNRIRRRLKEALRLAPVLEARADHDYVLVARIEALVRPFETLKNDLARALIGAHTQGARAAARPKIDDRDQRR
jgi:ribonuclease P protein component